MSRNKHEAVNGFALWSQNHCSEQLKKWTLRRTLHTFSVQSTHSKAACCTITIANFTNALSGRVLKHKLIVQQVTVPERSTGWVCCVLYKPVNECLLYKAWSSRAAQQQPSENIRNGVCRETDRNVWPLSIWPQSKPSLNQRAPGRSKTGCVK